MRKLPDIKAKQPSAAINAIVGWPEKHESAFKHVTGQAVYIDDQLEMSNQLYAAVGTSQIAHGKIRQINLTEVYKADGVIAVVTANDVPGQLDIGPVFPGDKLLAKDIVEYYGQPLFVVAACSYQQACQAVKLAKISYAPLPATFEIKQALEQKSFIRPPHVMQRGNAALAINNAPHKIAGNLTIGGQEHFYLEGQIANVIPTEDAGVVVYTSSQHPSEIQRLVAEVLNIPFSLVTVEVRRLGGGFGGKETQAAPWACLAAILARITQQPVKLRLNRHDDMVMTGKRHPFANSYCVGFDNDGRILGAEFTLNANCGYSPDLSDAVVDCAMLHVDNAYYLDQVKIVGNRCKTHLASNTAFRGFGSPQGMLTMEAAIDDIACYLGKDPLTIRKINFYDESPQPANRSITPYYQIVEKNILPKLVNNLENNANYQQRRIQVHEFNAVNKVLKKGLSLTPVKFGISFTVKHLNQAGALIHIYTDGSIHLNHGGTEMGQGLFTKVAQIVAEEFQVDRSNVFISATRTDKVPNTTATAASSGTDLNGKAAQNAAKTIKKRLTDFIAQHFAVDKDEITFIDNYVKFGERSISFSELIQLAYVNRISLSATGYYSTPKIHYDREKATGRPFFYFANGAAVSEVIVDRLTGEYKVLRVDILHDVGKSINPVIDTGQIEGGFVQGMGWLTTEELVWDDQGQLLTTGPATYKIPTIGDIPVDFRIQLFSDTPNPEHTIYHSKAVGEPPFMLAISVWAAIRDAISSISNYSISPKLDTPATPERVLQAIDQVSAESQAGV
ncbi:xanthine dehydrogenase molybdopterin binding subunit [Zooshikella sp. RANM57]|uniref:xanthine dehydrogenase molybdopterin binding subunit n=1 Tax=Zooshikella sp. RANM57 TaxID=3425863 RepID=UPI003D6FD3AB